MPAKAGYQKPIVQYYRGIERIPTEPIAIYRWEKKRKLSLSLSIDRQIMPIHYSLSYQNRYNYPIFRVADKKIAKRIFLIFMWFECTTLRLHSATSNGLSRYQDDRSDKDRSSRCHHSVATNGQVCIQRSNKLQPIWDQFIFREKQNRRLDD